MNYTTYFANVHNLPEDVVPISIARWSPKSWTGLEYKKLAPSAELLSEYKQNPNQQAYRLRYAKQLGALDPNVVNEELLKTTGGRPYALVCFEGKGKFCHRHVSSDWMRAAGINIIEL